MLDISITFMGTRIEANSNDWYSASLLLHKSSHSQMSESAMHALVASTQAKRKPTKHRNALPIICPLFPHSLQIQVMKYGPQGKERENKQV